MKKDFTLGLLVGLLLFGCAAFQFKYYGLDCLDCQGTLLGPNLEADRPLTDCKPDEQVKGKCVVMKTEEFELMRMQYEDMATRLKECEKARPQ